jgi:integrase
LPADVASKLDGQRLTLDVAGEVSAVTLRPTTKVSLRTKDDREALLRHAAVQSQLQQRWAGARTGAVILSNRDVHALAGVWYRDLITTHEDDPGDADSWEIYQELLGEGLAYLDPESDGVTSEPYDPRRATRILSRQFNIDEFLSARGLKLDEGSRTKLIENVAAALVQGAETLKRRAKGDYGADEVAKRFPPWRPDKERITSPLGSGASITALFNGWAKESRPAQATLDLWRGYVKSFISYTGSDDALAVQRSDVVKWKQHLLELGNSPKTINDSKLAALRAILRWAVDNELIPTNPATGVSVRRGKKASEQMLGFERDEAATILRAASRETSTVYRWVPLLCAQSGARVSEVCQLRGEDIRCEAGIWFMHIRPEAGSLKNLASERKVPLHPHVREVGFLEFVARSGKGPLFFDPKGRRPGAKKPQPKIVAKNVARWVHKLGIKVGLQFRKAPNHAWRHLFRTLARDVGIEESVVDAVLGHAAASVGRSYGETRLATAAKAIARIPLPGVADHPTGLAA